MHEATKARYIFGRGLSVTSAARSYLGPGLRISKRYGVFGSAAGAKKTVGRIVKRAQSGCARCRAWKWLLGTGAPRNRPAELMENNSGDIQFYRSEQVRVTRRGKVTICTWGSIILGVTPGRITVRGVQIRKIASQIEFRGEGEAVTCVRWPRR